MKKYLNGNVVQKRTGDVILGSIISSDLLSSRLCCAESTTQHANVLGEYISPDLAVHLVHFNLRFDVPEMLDHVFMLSGLLGLCQVRSLEGGGRPRSDDIGCPPV